MKKFMIMFALFFSSFAMGQNIEFIVSAAPGGPEDVVARRLVELLESKSDLKFIVLNKPGAAHQIGYNHILSSNKPTLTISTSEILKSPVSQYVEEVYTLGHFSNIVVVNAKSEFKDLNDLSKKQQVNFGSGGVDTFSHRAMQEICKSMNCVNIPFKGTSEGLLAILTNTIDTYAIVSYGSVISNNDKYREIGRIQLKNNWIKLFSKNIEDTTKEKIFKIIKDNKFTP
jgi:tripartite-type tricarboxylate transporter receptor subunit TctC